MTKKTRKILFWIMVPCLLVAFVIGIILEVTKPAKVVEPVVTDTVEMVVTDTVAADTLMVEADTTAVDTVE